MSYSGFNTGSATKRAMKLKVSPVMENYVSRKSHQELELKLATLERSYADLHASIFEATQVHRRLCAPRLVGYGNFDIASEIFAVRHLPGDFFTIRNSSRGVILALGDICGKGLAAGMWTTHLVGLVGARSAISSEPETIVAGVNRDICLMSSVVPLASLFVGRLDPETGKLVYCSAGHPPSLLLRADGQLEQLSEGGLLLGVTPTAPYKSGCVELRSGDVLLAYSDGVTESRNSAEDEFGCERLEVELRRSRSATASAILFSVLAAVQDFAGPCPLVDDLSLVVVQAAATKEPV